MTRSAHHGRETWLSACERWAATTYTTGAPDERALLSMQRVVAESEHGGNGIGRSGIRAACRDWDALLAELTRRLETAGGLPEPVSLGQTGLVR